MKIEVGKTYKDESGNKVEIVGKYASERKIEVPFIGLIRNSEGMISHCLAYSEHGWCAGWEKMNLVPNKTKHERYYGFFRKEGSQIIVFAGASNPKQWETLKAQYAARHELLKEGYDYVEVEE